MNIIRKLSLYVKVDKSRKQGLKLEKETYN